MMSNWQKATAIGSTKFKAIASHLWQESRKTPHHRLVACGLLVGAAYFPFWLSKLVVGSMHGAASILLVAMIAIALHRLWIQRDRLVRIVASSDDRLLGHILLCCGLALSPIGFFSEWAQRLIFLLILAGIAYSTWGLDFFRRYPLPVALIILGLFPQPTLVGKTLWEVFTPPRMLEQFMAWSGTEGLRAIGQSASVSGSLITLPGGSVDVNWGCSGFDMATILATASFVLGLFLKQNFPKIMLMMTIGVFLAFLANIPRIMLLAMSEAYWGKSAFEFWHGPWGGQIFASILFTIYYYVVMAIAKRKPAK